MIFARTVLQILSITLVISLIYPTGIAESLQPTIPDENGYVFFCLCMGRFGNQVEHFLGGLAFAKALNRTLVLPPFRTYKNIPFDAWFRVDAVSSYHRVILADDFLRDVAPSIWPAEKRYGFCTVLQNDDKKHCEMKDGNPFGNFWNELGVNFSRTIGHSLSHYKIDLWKKEYPAKMYPVLALKGAPASFPMAKSSIPLQSYLQFSDEILRQAEDLRNSYLNGSVDYVAVHLRNGMDWENTCKLVGNVDRLMASYQCLDLAPGVSLSYDMCFPSSTTVLSLTKNIVEKENVKYLFIATDKNPMISQFKKAMPNIKVVHVDPWLPIVDAILLTNSKHFIGNCVSSFSSFVWRHRLCHGLGPTSHFGFTTS